MLKVAALRETAPGERRVALDPDSTKRLIAAGVEVLIESGAGGQAWFADESYAEAGAKVVDRASAIGQADLIVSVTATDADLVGQLRSGQAVLGMLGPLTNPELVRQLAASGVTGISLDGLPRTLTRAQSMDALSSQASVAGYRAVLLAAEH